MSKPSRTKQQITVSVLSALLIAVPVWLVAHYIGIPAALGIMTYLLLRLDG